MPFYEINIMMSGRRESQGSEALLAILKASKLKRDASIFWEVVS